MNVTIPTDLSEITLGQLQSLTDIENSDLPTMNKQRKVVELLTELKLDEIERIRFSDLELIYSRLLHLSKRDDRLSRFVTLEGVKYGFHPNISEITTGEFADLDTLCQDFNTNLHLILAILYRPVVKELRGKYEIEKYSSNIEERALLFKRSLPANVVNGAMVFFWTLGKDYLRNTATSLQEELQIKSK